MTLTMPAEAYVGQEFTYTLNPCANDCLGEVIVRDVVPNGATYVSSNPAAQVSGNKLVWNLGDLDAGDCGAIQVTVRANQEGSLRSCATIDALPRVCAEIRVGAPQLAIEKSGPGQATIGSQITYNVVVRNTGSATARNVVVRDAIPPGLTHASGQSSLEFPIGDLQPNESKSVPVTVTAAQRGEHCNRAVASSSNAGEVSDNACTRVVEPGLAITKTGEPKEYLNKFADYSVTVSNIGDIPLTNVVVTDNAPRETSIKSADGATISGNQATWNVGTLEPGQQKSFAVTLTSSIEGTHCNTVSATTSEGLSESAESCTIWTGLPALLLEVVDDPDPIQVGEDTVYTIRVTNQGTADDTNIKVAVTFPAELNPINAGNGQINGKTVTFPPYPRLASKASVQYRITARGASPGVTRIKVTQSSDYLISPILEEESTRVY
jgi:uncharacterized repeat protein (TIGR01451 family)